MFDQKRNDLEAESPRRVVLKELSGYSNESRNTAYSIERPVRRESSFDFAAARERLSKKIPMLRRQWVKD